MLGLLICFTCSGASGLIYEVAWVRSLELIFGTTTFAVATVLAAFMGGLACGSYVMGRWSGRWGGWHPLKVYAVLEVLIAVVALGIPLLLDAMVPAYQWAWRTAQASFTWFSILRFLLSAAVLLVPTFLMGATLPVASRLVSRDEALGERRIGLLYAFNTLGAVLGCLGAGLVLFPAVGLAGTQQVALVLNLAAAGGAWLLARRTAWAPAAEPAAGTRSETAAERSAETPGKTPGETVPEAGVERAAQTAASSASVSLAGRLGVEAKLLVWAYAVSGFVAMLYEVAWSRVLVLVLGSSTYAYTIMLGTFLLGLALGAGLMTRLVNRGLSPLVWAAVIQAFIGVTTLAGLRWVEELPYWYLKAWESWQPSPRGLMGLQFLLASGLMILPTLGLGAMFPVAMRGLNPRGDGACRVVGWAYALNTIGAIAGSVVAGFLLLPQIGSQKTMQLGVALNVVLVAAALLSLQSGPGWLVRWRGAAAIGLLLLGGNLIVSVPPWNAAVLSSGVFRYARDYAGLDREGFRERARRIAGDVLMFEEGLTCTVTVSRTPESVTLMVNGKPDASAPSGLGNPLDTNAPAALYDLPTQILLGQLPLLLAPRQDNVLVIGLGSGLTVGSVLTHPVKRVDCIELEDAVVRGSRFFEEHNGRPLEDGRTRIVVNDARNHLLVTDEAYDVIISEPSNPWIPGAANLFTRESFEQSRRRLSADGVFCQWLQLYELQSEDFATVLRTFLSVFPNVHLFRVNHDAILVGAMSPQSLDEGRLRERLAGGLVRADLERIGLRGVEDVLARYWVGGEELAACVPSGPFNTDDNRRIEFAAPLRVLAGRDRDRDRERRSGVASIAALFEGRTRAAVPHVRLASGTDPAGFWAGVSEAALRLQAVEALVYARHSLGLGLNPRAVGVQVDAWLAQGRLEDARRLLAEAERMFPQAPEVLRALTRLEMREQRWTSASGHAERWLERDRGSAAARYAVGRCRFMLKEDAAALAALEGIDPALARDEAFRDLPFYLGALYARAGRHAPAIENLHSFLRRMPLHAEARTLLATTLDRAGRGPEAAVQWQKIAVLNIRRSETLRREALDLWRDGKKPESLARLAEALKLDPSNTDMAVELARARVMAGELDLAARTLREHLAWNPDRAPAIGYLSEVLSALQREDESRLMAARYRALTGGAWPAAQTSP